MSFAHLTLGRGMSSARRRSSSTRSGTLVRPFRTIFRSNRSGWTLDVASRSISFMSKALRSQRSKTNSDVTSPVPSDRRLRRAQAAAGRSWRHGVRAAEADVVPRIFFQDP